MKITANCHTIELTGDPEELLKFMSSARRITYTTSNEPDVAPRLAMMSKDKPEEQAEETNTDWISLEIQDMHNTD